MKRYTGQFKTVKAFLCLAVLLLVAKPFLGFSIFSRIHPPSQENIFVKAFTKRKQEYAKGSSYNIEAVQKRLAEPLSKFSLLFTNFLVLHFPSVLDERLSITDELINQHNLRLSVAGTHCQRTSILII